MNFDYQKYFPFSKIRSEQDSAIRFALNAFLNEGKKYVLLEMGTGCGKSATGYTIAKYVSDLGTKTGAYFLTTQKILQEQYLRDFGNVKNVQDRMRSIKSSSNYRCMYYTEQTCGESKRLLHTLKSYYSGSEFNKQCSGQKCQYTLDKQQFVTSKLSLTNFSYFLSECLYVGSFEPREILVIDECHNVESELSKFVEVSFSERFAKDVLSCKLLPRKSNYDENVVINWIKKSYKTSLSKKIKTIQAALKVETSENLSQGNQDLAKQYTLLDKHICKLNRFIDEFESNPKNWILNCTETAVGKKTYMKYEFKPVTISEYAKQRLLNYGDKVLLMSATVVDKAAYCKSIGLDPQEVAYLRIPSPFPVENKPIYYFPVGKMSKSEIDKTLPNLAVTVAEILKQHEDVKGIIHCVSFKVAKYLHDTLKNDRLLIHDSTNRDATLTSHVYSDIPTVLLSPSMMEGVDLADDASRFQIICKIPFPYLGDKVVQRRKELDSEWYSYQTVKSIIQAMGRSIRNENDHAISYILDADWAPFFQRNRRMFPDDFINSLRL